MSGATIKPMTFGSVCSGIEAASVAWLPLGWRCAWLSEIEPFPSAVLKHHYPDVRNYGDFTTISEPEPIDVLIGGTPCQSFSIAGSRGGLGDERGNLCLEYLKLAERVRPRWLVWENVPGVLSSLSHDAPDPSCPKVDMDLLEDGAEMDTEDEYSAEELHAFACFLAGLSIIGYQFAYRVFDAQYFGLAQRRERIFVVGYLGDWRRAAAVLFDAESLCGYPPPSHEAGEDVSPTLSARTKGGGGLGTDFDCDGGLIAHALNGKSRLHGQAETFITSPLTTRPYCDNASRESALLPSTMPTMQAGGANNKTSHRSQSGDTKDKYIIPVALNLRGREGGSQFEESHLASLRAASGGSSRSYVQAEAVRRMTPLECERLQGFPDGYTAVPYRGKPAADNPRYKALGNSMAVPVIRWIGERIAMVDQL